MQFATLLAFLSTFALGSNGLTLKGSPSRVDTIVLDSSSEALLAELSGVTVLDTGLTILPGVCDVTDAATKLAGTFAQLYVCYIIILTPLEYINYYCHTCVPSTRRLIELNFLGVPCAHPSLLW